MAKARRRGPTMIQRSRRVSPELKARVHTTTGAGRSRVVRDFLGLDAEDERAILAALQTKVDVRIRASR